MAYSFDPQVAAALTALLQVSGRPAPAARGDWRSLRAMFEPAIAAMDKAMPVFADVARSAHHLRTDGGESIGLRWYARADTRPGPAVVYFHGGGMIGGSVDLVDNQVACYASTSGVPILSVDYRLAPEHPYPAPVEDGYAALRWLHENAERLGVDPARIAVMGESGGGAVAAGVALLARDRKLALARQILIYPMLDDRNTIADPNMVPFATWTYDSNFTAWQAVLGQALGSDSVPPAAAPSRAQDLRGVAPAYIEVGELDIFRDEDIEYARRIAACGISVELHVHPGAPHGFDRLAPDSDVSRRAAADRVRVLKQL